MTYTAQEWSDYPSGGTPISAARLNHMEQGILQASLDAGGLNADGTASSLVAQAKATADTALSTANTALTNAANAKSSADALGLTVTTTSAFKAATGWTINRQNFVKIGRWVAADVSLNRTGGTISVDSSGNILNTLLGTVPESFRCALQYGGIPMGPGGSLGGIYISGVQIFLAAYAPSVNITNGREVTFAGPWLTAG